MRILISWIADSFDFKGNIVSELSPNRSIHEYGVVAYKKHYVLSTKKGDDLKMELLINHLRNRFPKTEFISEYLNLSDAYDLKSILNAITSFTNDLDKEFEIDILFSNGTRVMSIAWVIYYSNRSRTVRLLQGISPEYNKKERIPKFVQISFDESFPGIISFSNKDETILETKSNLVSKERAILIAKYPVSCTIIGESGTGKEHTAYSIHKNSVRANKKYIAVNCASLSDDLLESRLFGYKKGAFTGANEDRKGFFDAADQGSIFLDEIGDISPKLQQSLLRVLQDGTIMPVGSNEEHKVDVRIITATNKNLKDEVKNKRFREDLYYRIFETNIKLMPLREYSIIEIKMLTDHFMQLNSQRFSKKLVLKESVKQQIASYDFPGNIRELQSIIINFFVFCNDEVTLDDLPKEIHQHHKNSYNLINANRLHIEKTFLHFNRNIQQTARALGIATNTLKNKLRKFHILNIPETAQTQK